MKPSVKKAWVKALRSDEYKQGQGILRSGDNRFCSLGVLADVALDDYWVFSPRDDDWKIGNQRYTLNPLYQQRLGLTKEATSQLILLNDVAAVNFDRIADWVEENL